MSSGSSFNSNYFNTQPQQYPIPPSQQELTQAKSALNNQVTTIEYLCSRLKNLESLVPNTQNSGSSSSTYTNPTPLIQYPINQIKTGLTEQIKTIEQLQIQLRRLEANGQNSGDASSGSSSILYPIEEFRSNLQAPLQKTQRLQTQITRLEHHVQNGHQDDNNYLFVPHYLFSEYQNTFSSEEGHQKGKRGLPGRGMHLSW